MHLKQHIHTVKRIVCVFVILKATDGRRANKRDNLTYLHFQLFKGYSFKATGYSAVTLYGPSIYK